MQAMLNDPAYRKLVQPAGNVASPYVFDTILDESTWSGRRLGKKKLKLLARIDPKLRAILEEDERVRYVTFGSGVSFLESYFLGWAMYYLNLRAIVLTDRRIVLIQIDSRRRPRELVSQVRYRSIGKIARTLLGNTKLTLGDGTAHVFSHVPRRDRKFLRNLGDWIGQSMARDPAGWEDLCPHCYNVVQGRPGVCPHCRGRFKSARRAGLLSLAFPGLGDVYLAHYGFAAMQIIVALFIWLSVAMAALYPDPRYPETVGTIVGTAIFIFMFLHGMDAIGALFIARKGLYPAKGVGPGDRPAPTTSSPRWHETAAVE